MSISIKKYVSKPVTIEAVEFGKDVSAKDIADWIRENGGEVGLVGGGWVKIRTLEGTMTAKRGDFIIRGTIGEFYPVKPEVFLEKYRQVVASANLKKKK